MVFHTMIDMVVHSIVVRLIPTMVVVIDTHYYTGATHQSTRLEEVDMSEKEIADYMAGYEYNEQFGDKKCYD